MEGRIQKLLAERKQVKVQKQQIAKDLKLERRKKKRMVATLKRLSKQDLLDIAATCAATPEV